MRVFSTKSPEISKRVMTWTGFIYLGRGMLPMLWGVAALTLFGVGALDDGVPLPVVNGQTLPPIDAMPAMLASMLGPAQGIVVAVISGARFGETFRTCRRSAVISQDISRSANKCLAGSHSRSQIFVIVRQPFVWLFLILGLYYTPPGSFISPDITGTIFCGARSFGDRGLYWQRR